MPVNGSGVYQTPWGPGRVDSMGLHSLICCYLDCWDCHRLDFPDEIDKLIFAAFDMSVSDKPADNYLNLAIKLNSNGTMQWLRGPHGATLFKALLIKKGLKL
jgi:hypothetical protein